MMKRADLTEFEIEEKRPQIAYLPQERRARDCFQFGSTGTCCYVSSCPGTGSGSSSCPPGTRKAAGTRHQISHGGDFLFGSFTRKPAFVKVGDSVGPDTTVCIIEAMKVMNEIKAETSGTIAEFWLQTVTPWSLANLCSV
ncbi:MAG: hypothetical protein LR015_11465 [Verrucomicrobia bacterium]|nr:hypothetical protein [Verrucomicrobiota bacterium]